MPVDIIIRLINRIFIVLICVNLFYMFPVVLSVKFNKALTEFSIYFFYIFYIYIIGKENDYDNFVYFLRILNITFYHIIAITTFCIFRTNIYYYLVLRQRDYDDFVPLLYFRKILDFLCLTMYGLLLLF